MQRRLGRLATVFALLGALVLGGAIYEAWRTPSDAEAETPAAQREQVEKASKTPVGLWSADEWAQYESLLRTDEQASAYADDFTTMLRAVMPMPGPGLFYENVTLAKVSKVRGVANESVWQARYDVEVGSNETTFTTVYAMNSTFGPGLTPADAPPTDLSSVYAFADLEWLSHPQRVAFLTYWKSNKINNMQVVARLDREFPGAPWYEDNALRESLLAAGKKAGLGPSDLVFYFSGPKRTGVLVGYDADAQTWSRLKYAPPNYPKWYARKNAEAAAAAAVAQAKAEALLKKSAKAKRAATATSTAAAPRAGSTAQAPPYQVPPTGSTAQAPPYTAQAPQTGGTTQGTPSTTGEVENGGAIPTTETPWYNMLFVGVMLIVLGAVGLARQARRRHV